MKQFWHGRRVLITGHTGFKGAWLVSLLRELGAVCAGYALSPRHKEALYFQANTATKLEAESIADIRDFVAISEAIASFSPEFIFHLAAQPLVIDGYKHPYETFTTNTLGTLNVIEALRRTPCVKVATIITTDKVYRTDLAAGQASFSEDDALWGFDPYSASKVGAELIAQSYQKSILRPDECKIIVARAGNVIGGGDWADNRLIPDLMRALIRGEPTLEVRYPHATRPWQHVLEPLRAYLMYAEAAYCGKAVPVALNFGPAAEDCISVSEVIRLASTSWGNTGLEIRSPVAPQKPETHMLSIDNGAAQKVLGVRPIFPVAEAIEKTVSWYQRFSKGENPDALVLSDIQHFLHRSGAVARV